MEWWWSGVVEWRGGGVAGWWSGGVSETGGTTDQQNLLLARVQDPPAEFLTQISASLALVERGTPL